MDSEIQVTHDKEKQVTQSGSKEAYKILKKKQNIEICSNPLNFYI